MFSNLSFTTVIEGLILGLGLIIPIGTQNAYLLRLGISGRYVFMAALFCSISDSILISVGAMGVGTYITNSPLLRRVMVAGGAVFLLYYGIKCILRVYKPLAIATDEADTGHTTSLKMVILTSIAFSLFNPHAILDATLLIGSIAGQYETLELKISFTIGAVVASWLWFFALAYFAKFLKPLFQKQITNQILDASVALFMFAISYHLVMAEILM